jgi:CspA family cold shock protein
MIAASIGLIVPAAITTCNQLECKEFWRALTSPSSFPTLGAAFGRRRALCDRYSSIAASYLAQPAVHEAPGTAQASRASEDTAMPTGTIARLLIDKGFGFIRDEGGIEHFFHRSAVRGAVFELLREGQRVEFSSEESTKGPRAGDVRLIES